MNHNLAINTGPVKGLVRFGLNNPVDDLHFWDLYRQKQLSPEKELTKAVLEQGIEFATMNCGNGFNYKSSSVRLSYRNEAREWIAERSDWGLFSFARVCQTLGLDVDAVRKAIEARY